MRGRDTARYVRSLADSTRPATVSALSSRSSDAVELGVGLADHGPELLGGWNGFVAELAGDPAKLPNRAVQGHERDDQHDEGGRRQERHDDGGQIAGAHRPASSSAGVVRSLMRRRTSSS